MVSKNSKCQKLRFIHHQFSLMLIDKSEIINLDLTSKNKWGRTGFQLARKHENVNILISIEMPSLVIPFPGYNSAGMPVDFKTWWRHTMGY